MKKFICVMKIKMKKFICVMKIKMIWDFYNQMLYSNKITSNMNKIIRFNNNSNKIKNIYNKIII